MVDRIVVACNLLDLTIEDLKFNEILKDNGFSLNDISKDLISIILNKNDSLLSLSNLEKDLFELSLASGIMITPLEFYSELDWVIANVVYRLNQINIKRSKLIDIHFHIPDSVFFTFSCNPI